MRSGPADAIAVVFAAVLTASHKGQILRPVVAPDLVPVVADFVWSEIAPQYAFQHEAVLEHVSTRVGVRVLRRKDVDVPGDVEEASAAPRVIGRAEALRTVGGEARDGMAAEVPLRALGIARDRRHATAAAFAATGRDLLGARLVPDMAGALVALQEGGDAVAVLRMRLDGAAASAGACARQQVGNWSATGSVQRTVVSADKATTVRNFGPASAQAIRHARILTRDSVRSGQSSNLEA